MTREEFDATRWYNWIKVRERGKRAKIDVCIDWVIRLVAVMSLLMTGFSAGCGDYLVATSFAMNIVCVVLLAVTRKEMRVWKRRNTSD
ncbi:hypothetical protein [uncultured Porphyromonas sp.]|jgi:hypothetical protein|uniref:hypothetical protein n=1 Tax=uncultured Porphyromonas sp. TaxID=159274 RepID=UPI0027DD3EAF|nr:hypothetical protein [uncultured Porphyromonas sp.]